MRPAFALGAPVALSRSSAGLVTAAVAAAVAGWVAGGARARRRTAVVRAALARLEDELDTARHNASHDPLTGLLNRAGLVEAADRLFAAGDRRYLALLVDLDGFKPVNDTYGHHTGDAVLRAVADRLHLYTEPLGGVCARLGGDEYAALVPVPAGACGHAVAWARHTLAELRARLTVPGHVVVEGQQPVAVGASVGGALTEPPQSGVELASLLHHADLAMYAAKTSGAGAVLAGEHPVAPCRFDQDEDAGRSVLRTRDLPAFAGATAGEVAR